MNFTDDVHSQALENIFSNPRFDLDKQYNIDFNVFFSQSPPPEKAIELLKINYPAAELSGLEGDSGGYVDVTIQNLVSYKFITTTLADISNLVRPFGGSCEYWGVFVD